MLDGAIGRVYSDGDCIVRQGEKANCMYIIQSGHAEVIIDSAGGEQVISVLEVGDTFGEMSLFTKEPRSATVRAKGEVRALTIDKRGFFRRVHEDPTLAFKLLQRLSQRLQKVNAEIALLRQS